jgi:hypothetical protein
MASKPSTPTNIPRKGPVATPKSPSSGYQQLLKQANHRSSMPPLPPGKSSK